MGLTKAEKWIRTEAKYEITDVTALLIGAMAFYKHKDYIKLWKTDRKRCCEVIHRVIRLKKQRKTKEE